MGCGASTSGKVHPHAVTNAPSRTTLMNIRSMMAYMPAAVSEYYNKKTTKTPKPALETFTAAVLFADISGFSLLLEQLSQHRDTEGGSERLTYLMNGFLGDIVDSIVTCGGDIIQFAGDSFLAIWRAKKPFLEETTLGVIQCAFDVQRLISESEISNGAQAVALKMRIEIGAGDVTGIHFGNDERQSYFVVGQEIDSVYLADKMNTPGKIVLTKSAYKLLKKSVLAEKIDESEYYQFMSMNSDQKVEPVATLGGIESDDICPPEEFIIPYIPSNVGDFLRARQVEWLAEVRIVTMVFVKLPKFPGSVTDKGYGPFMQDNLCDVLNAIERHNGMLAHLSSDDKGIFCVIVLGIPSHENDAVRGISTAVEIAKRFSDKKVESQIGVATGVAVSCSVGSKHRCQYTLYGGTVNLAARLMVASLKCKVPILCDEATSIEAKSRFVFRTLDPVELKGFGKVSPCTPELQTSWNQKIASELHPSNISDSDLTDSVKTVGRNDELNFFAEAKQNMLDLQESASMIIEADIGQGRSTLINKLSQSAKDSGLKVLYGEGDSIEITPFHAFKSMLVDIFRVNAVKNADSIREKVSKKIPVQYLPYLVLLNSILPINFPESETSLLLKGPARIEMLNKMVVALLQQAILQNPTLMVIQEAQWLDSASWTALQSVVHSVHPLLVIIGTRPIPNPMPATYQTLISYGARHFTLGNLTVEQSMEVISDQLGIQGPPPANLVNFVQVVTSGNLLFMTELLAKIKLQEDVLTIQNGKVTFNEVKAANNKLSRNMQLLLSSKIDNLTPDSQLLIRVASVIGRVFHWNAAVYIFPVDTRRPHLEEDLKALEELELISFPESREQAIESKLPLQFKNALIQQIVYSSMVSKQREQLHARAAEWYSVEYGTREDAGAYYATILHHYENAQMQAESFTYAIKAAEYALSISALEESISFFKKAMAFPQSKDLSENRRAKIIVLLSDSLMGCGKVVEAAKVIQDALVSLGCTDPIEESLKYTEDELSEQFFGIKFVTPIPQDDYAEREKQMDILTLYTRLILSYGFTQSKSLPKLVFCVTIAMKKILLATGYEPCFPGIMFAMSIAFGLRSDAATAEKYHEKGMEALRNPINLQDYPVQLHNAITQLQTRTYFYTLLTFFSRGEFSELEQTFKQSQQKIKAAHDMRGLMLSANNFSHALMFQGRFTEALSVAQEHAKIANDIGDRYQFGLLFSLCECLCMLRLGNTQDAFLKLQQIEAIQNTTTIIDERIKLQIESMCYFNVLRALCHLQRKELSQAHSFITLVETEILEHETATPVHMVPYVVMVEVLCELATDPHYPGSKKALASWVKIQPRFESHGLRFSVCTANVLLRKAQLAKIVAESESLGDVDELRTKFIAELEAVIEQTKNMNLNYDMGLIHATLAKTYLRFEPQALDHFMKAQALFTKTGSMRNFIETKQYWERDKPGGSHSKPSSRQSYRSNTSSNISTLHLHHTSSPLASSPS